MEIERAIRLLVEQYNRALKSDEIDADPVSFAAFMVMREADSESHPETYRSDSKLLTREEIFKRDENGRYVLDVQQRINALEKLKESERRMDER